MKLKGLSAWLPPTRLHAFSAGMLIGFALAFASIMLCAKELL